MTEHPFDYRTFRSDDKWVAKYCINFMCETHLFPRKIINLFTEGYTLGALDWELIMEVNDGVQRFTAILGPEEHRIDNVDEIRLDLTRDEFLSLLKIACAWFDKRNPSQIEELNSALKIAGIE